MAIIVTKRELNERTAADVRASHPHLFTPAKRTNVGPIPSEQKVVVCLLAVGAGVTVGDQDALESAIEAIGGVSVCKVHSYGQAVAVEDVPDGKEIILTVEAGFGFRAVAE